MPILDYRLLTLIAANARKKQSKRHGLLKKIHFLCKKSTIMQKLLSLPPNLVSCFHELEKAGQDEWFCTADPAGNKLGSGGGTTWLLRQWRENRKKAQENPKKIILHAGGQSRRLPAYAPSGKILTPIPVFRWTRGQKLGQNLLSLQLSLYEKIMRKAPDSLRTLIASGDVYIRAEKPLQEIPEADVVCYGIWADPNLATHHGIFVSRRECPEQLDFMLQKPSIRQLEELTQTHFFLMDIGIWLLNDKALRLLEQRSTKGNAICYYDLYSDFGQALGNHPCIQDKELNRLSIAILPLPGGEFYHYGTSRELLSSTLNIQEKVRDQRQIMHRKVKPNPAIFIQNAKVDIPLASTNQNIWIENSHISKRWTLGKHQIITGVPCNDWQIHVPDGICIDIVPLCNGKALRPYGFDDLFKGRLDDPHTLFLGQPFPQWLADRGLAADDILCPGNDMQTAALFPVIQDMRQMEEVLLWMIKDPERTTGKQLWIESPKLSADELTVQADLKQLYAQRENFCKRNWEQLANNYERSIFYQLDLADAAQQFHHFQLPAPRILPAEAPLMQRIHNRMLRAQVGKLNGNENPEDEAKAFALLREGLLSDLREHKSNPQFNVHSDQIVWSRSPVRIDVAGGWTDTPPYSLFAGGNVVNIAIELNGQPPLQVYIKPCEPPHIVLRSIDMGAMEEIHTYEELQQYNKVGSPFSIPKAALALAGFIPEFSGKHYPTLKQQLTEFGTGMEITLLSAIPAGSGLGTSSILASTVLGALSDFCGLMWDKNEICHRTMALEQLLTTGGGWQDQYGGILHGAKLLQTNAGFIQKAMVRWLPEHLFNQPGYRECHLLYYTGITRTAKGILAEIVRSMFLNSNIHLRLLEDMKQHALDMAEAIQKNDFNAYGCLVGKSWEQNKQLDSGTNPPTVEKIICQIKDYALGYKLPGAGGGGYLYIVAKDPQAATRIHEILTNNKPNPRARFVEMKLSDKGFQISRS